MRIVVLSVTHGRVRNFKKIYQKQSRADLFIHLGDGGEEVDMMRVEHPRTAFVTVRGNCDYYSDEPYDKLMVLDAARVFLTHGHRYSVKSGLGALLEAARAQKADIALFGHTHTPFYEYSDGLHIMNPGSAERPRRGRPGFGIIDITKGGVVAFLAEL